MKKIILSLIATLIATSISAQIKIDQQSFTDLASKNISVSSSDFGMTNMLAGSMDWPLDADGGENIALLYIRFKNVPLVEYDNFKIVDTEVPMPATDQKAVSEENGEYLLKVFIPAHNGADIDISHPSYGPARLTNKNIEPHHIYFLTVENSKLVSISVNSDPQGATIVFDGKNTGLQTPATINNVTLGRHQLQLLAGTNSRMANDLPTQIIDVTDTKLLYEYNLRKTKNVRITSRPDGAMLTVIKSGNVEAKGKSPLNVTLPYGEYVVHAELGTAFTETPITINANTGYDVEVSVNKSREITINAVQNNEPVNNAGVNINGDYMGLVGRAYKLDYGTYNVQINYQGYYTSKRLVVNEKTKPLQTYRLPNRQRYNHVWNPFDEDYNKREWGIVFNYINRAWVFKVDGARQKYNAWGDEGKSEHGFQLGIAYNPYFGYGQGLVTGLYWQMFMSFRNDLTDSPIWTDNALYIPLQYQFRLPLSEDFSIYINAGLGMTLGLANELDYGEDNGGSLDLGYGETDYGYWPNRVQFSVPVGAGVQYKALVVDFKYSWGLNDNKDMYTADDDVKASCKMKTWSLGVHVMF